MDINRKLKIVGIAIMLLGGIAYFIVNKFVAGAGGDIGILSYTFADRREKNN